MKQITILFANFQNERRVLHWGAPWTLVKNVVILLNYRDIFSWLKNAVILCELFFSMLLKKLNSERREIGWLTNPSLEVETIPIDRLICNCQPSTLIPWYYESNHLMYHEAIKIRIVTTPSTDPQTEPDRPGRFFGSLAVKSPEPRRAKRLSPRDRQRR